MILHGIDFYNFKRHCVDDGEYYRFNFGNKIRVTTLCKDDNNYLLSSTLSYDTKEDKMIKQYCPNRRVYIDKDLIDNHDDSSKLVVSCFIDSKTSFIYMGTYNKYPLKDGALVMSGYVDSHGRHMKREICALNCSKKNFFKKAMVVAVGEYKGDIRGLVLLSSDRGLAFRKQDSDLGISAKTEKEVNCADWSTYIIDDWFEKCKLEEIE